MQSKLKYRENDSFDEYLKTIQSTYERHVHIFGDLENPRRYQGGRFQRTEGRGGRGGARVSFMQTRSNGATVVAGTDGRKWPEIK